MIKSKNLGFKTLTLINILAVCCIMAAIFSCRAKSKLPVIEKASFLFFAS